MGAKLLVERSGVNTLCDNASYTHATRTFEGLLLLKPLHETAAARLALAVQQTFFCFCLFF